MSTRRRFGCGHFLNRILRSFVLFVPMGVALLLAADSAHALIVTTDFYHDDDEDFVWVFTWDGTAGPLKFAPPAGSASGAWVPGGPVGGAMSPVGGFVGANLLRQGTNLGLTARHAKGPHHGIDQDPGDPFTIVVSSGDYAAVTGAPFQTLFDVNCPICSPHHDPHFDAYTLKYQRLIGGAGQPVNFIFSGTHVVPEPTSLILFGLGMLATAGYSRLRPRL